MQHGDDVIPIVVVTLK